MMRYNILALLLASFLTSCLQTNDQKNAHTGTVCNPVDLSYRFQLETPSRREAADPTVITFKGRYYLFASMSGGYWHSKDLKEWKFVRTDEIPTEEYAPTAIVLGDTVYFLASSTERSTIYKSSDPLSGHWSVALEALEVPVWDPAFYLDEDDRLYLYWGCSNQLPIYGVEVDYHNNFRFLGERKELIFADPERHGWEVRGDYNTLKDSRPWIEGAWMNRYNDRYHLQYSGPGTEFKSYADAVYVSDQPLGPFQLAPHNPVAYRPEGFAAGAGHGSTFQDQWGNYWHVGTATISVKHMFERRLAVYPAFFDAEGIFYTVTKFGDYPMIIPQKRIDCWEEIFPGWMLLSYGKKVTVSSSIDSLPPENMVDEDIRTYWSALSGNEREWAILDLGAVADVHAVQVNFAEHNTKIYGRQVGRVHQYVVEFSRDHEEWEMLIDRSDNPTDNSHDYTQLPAKVRARYLRIENRKVPDGTFALSGFRVFGRAGGERPGVVENLVVRRDSSDRRTATLQWSGSGNAIGYNVLFGTRPDKLYHTYQVYRDTSLVLNALDANRTHYFSIEAFNESGLAAPGQVVAVD